MIIIFLVVFLMGIMLAAGYDFTNIMAITTMLIIGCIALILFVAVHEKRKQTR